jgi:hypothetical protein
MKEATEEVRKVLERGSRLFSGQNAVEYFAQLVVAGLTILRQARGDKFVDDFLLMALQDKSVISSKEETTN